MSLELGLKEFDDFKNILNHTINDLHYNINNIKDIHIIGDIHGDITVLLDFLKKIDLVNWEYLKNIQPNDIINQDYYYYKLENDTYKENIIFLENNSYNLYHHMANGQENKIDIKDIDKSKDFTLYIGLNSYYNIFQNNIIYNGNNIEYNNNNMYKITFKLNNINKLNNSALVFLGDIVDTHYLNKDVLDKYYNYNKINVYYDMNEETVKETVKGAVSKELLYNNDVGCFHILFILKNIIEYNYDKNNKLIILFGNHELNATVLNYLFKNESSYWYYAITAYEKEEFQLEFQTLYNIKNKIRKDYIIKNSSLFNIIISINKKILLSHNFIYQIPFNNLITVLKNKQINIPDETKMINILEVIFRYVLHKINEIDKYSKRNIPELIMTLYQLFNVLQPKQKVRNLYGLPEIHTNPIICNNSLKELTELNENSCNYITHIVGHMTQKYDTDYRDNLNKNKNISNVPKNSFDYKPKYEDKQNALMSYNDFYLYFMDYHLSASFYNLDENDNNKYYYLHIIIESDDKINREFIQFRKEHEKIEQYIPPPPKPKKILI